jgi:PAS domain-containing protein
VFARDGTLAGYLGADRDITAQKQAERRMGEEEGQFRALVEQEIAGIYMIASDGVLAYVNPRFAAMFGYAPAVARLRRTESGVRFPSLAW